MQTGEAAGLPKGLAREVIEEMVGTYGQALEKIESELPEDFPLVIHTSVRDAMADRMRRLRDT